MQKKSLLTILLLVAVLAIGFAIANNNQDGKLLQGLFQQKNVDCLDLSIKSVRANTDEGITLEEVAQKKQEILEIREKLLPNETQCEEGLADLSYLMERLVLIENNLKNNKPAFEGVEGYEG